MRWSDPGKTCSLACCEPMEYFVEHIVEPEHLLLAWQAPDHMENRRRWVVARVDVQSEPWKLEYLYGEVFQLANSGAPYEEMLALGYEGYPAFSRMANRTHFEKGVQDAFMRRLPPRSRADFQSYIQRFGFKDGAGLSDAALLAYTEAKLPSDGFSLVGELKPELQFGDLTLDVAGTRYQPFGDSCPARPGDRLHLRREPGNAYDPQAIEILWGEERLGYVNRIQAPVVGYWLANRSVRAIVQRVNGRSGNPKIYVLLQVRPLNSILAA